mmetsp:Transcript_27739/g.95859  ORF Transcript_27739/g.95859 Transcript_27739/m.95859 type:complete len:243 (+) Transcript_27739:703-1431(+)
MAERRPFLTSCLVNRFAAASRSCAVACLTSAFSASKTLMRSVMSRTTTTKRHDPIRVTRASTCICAPFALTKSCVSLNTPSAAGSSNHALRISSAKPEASAALGWPSGVASPPGTSPRLWMEDSQSSRDLIMGPAGSPSLYVNRTASTSADSPGCDSSGGVFHCGEAPAATAACASNAFAVGETAVSTYPPPLSSWRTLTAKASDEADQTTAITEVSSLNRRSLRCLSESYRAPCMSTIIAA